MGKVRVWAPDPIVRLMNLVRSIATLGTAVFLLAGIARSEEIPEHFTTVRPTGMGGAFTAIANDENSIWTNPAGISRSRKARSRETFSVAKFPNLIVGANAESRTFYKGFKGAQEKSVEGILDSINDLGDKPFWARAAIMPVTLINISRETPMAFSLYSNTTVSAVIPSDSPTEAQVSAVSDVGGVVTFNASSDSNRFNTGFQIRPVARYAYEDKIPSEDLLNKDAFAETLEAGANKSTGLGADFGMMFSLADFWFPTVGLAILNLPTGCKAKYLNPYTEKPENVCGTVYKGDFGNADALSTVDPTDLRIGASITPRLSKKINIRFAVDAHHIPIGDANQSFGLGGIEVSKLFHAGAELFFGNPLTVSPFSLRAGYNQGFLTMGASMNLSIVALEFATYGADVSTSKTPIEDRRYMGSLSIDL